MHRPVVGFASVAVVAGSRGAGIGAPNGPGVQRTSRFGGSDPSFALGELPLQASSNGLADLGHTVAGMSDRRIHPPAGDTYRGSMEEVPMPRIAREVVQDAEPTR
jgi:hypothetical protein